MVSTGSVGGDAGEVVGRNLEPAERAIRFMVISGLSPAPRAADLGPAIPGVSLRFTQGFMLSPATAGSFAMIEPRNL